MSTVAREYEAGAAESVDLGALRPTRAPASRRQVAIARVVVATLAASTIAGAVALGQDTDGPTAKGRLAVPHFNDAPAVELNDPQVVKGARGGAFDDPVVIKGARGESLR
jgi:hypothetical protein